MENFLILKVPSQYGGCPYIQATEPGIVLKCLEVLTQRWPKVKSRSEVWLDKRLRAAEFHKLQDNDAQAGIILLDYLRRKGYMIERVDVSQSEHGDHVVAVVYNMTK